MRRLLLLPLFLLLSLLPALAQPWTSDILANGFESRRVDQGTDYSGPVVSTIVRKLTPGATRAVLYIHGFNDYFFQTELADQFLAHGYNFYAVDLRKYGRSLLPDQKPFEARSLNEYFPDIDSALVEINRSGIRDIVLMGHSTGGLISAYYLALNPNPAIKALLLNSPFLDWNLGWKERIVPLLSWVGGIFPRIPIAQSPSTAYAESLLTSAHGEWNFRTDWKRPISPSVTTGWIHAITSAQNALKSGHTRYRGHEVTARIPQPILLMYSSSTPTPTPGNEAAWNPTYNTGDAVLSPTDIRRYGSLLGPRVTCLRVTNGLHDLILSAPSTRYPLYTHIFAWLNRTLPTPQQ